MWVMTAMLALTTNPYKPTRQSHSLWARRIRHTLHRPRTSFSAVTRWTSGFAAEQSPTRCCSTVSRCWAKGKTATGWTATAASFQTPGIYSPRSTRSACSWVFHGPRCWRTLPWPAATTTYRKDGLGNTLSRFGRRQTRLCCWCWSWRSCSCAWCRRRSCCSAFRVGTACCSRRCSSWV